MSEFLMPSGLTCPLLTSYGGRLGSSCDQSPHFSCSPSQSDPTCSSQNHRHAGLMRLFCILLFPGGASRVRPESAVAKANTSAAGLFTAEEARLGGKSPYAAQPKGSGWSGGALYTTWLEQWRADEATLLPAPDPAPPWHKTH